MKKIRNGLFALVAVIMLGGCAFTFGGCALLDWLGGGGEGPETYAEQSFFMNGQTYDYVINNIRLCY